MLPEDAPREQLAGPEDAVALRAADAIMPENADAEEQNLHDLDVLLDVPLDDERVVHEDLGESDRAPLCGGPGMWCSVSAADSVGRTPGEIAPRLGGDPHRPRPPRRSNGAGPYC